MAVRLDVDGDELIRTVDLPAVNPLTVTMWIYLSADRNNWSTPWSLYLDVSNSLHPQTDGTGTQFDFRLRKNVGSSTVISMMNLTVGAWYFVCFQINSEILATAYWAAAGAAALSSGTAAFSAGAWFTPTTMKCGDSIFSAEWWNGRVAAIKIWTAALTAAEVAAERFYIRPRRFANLHGWWPCLAGATERLKDYSVAARNWTAAGTLTDEAPPPVAWGGMPQFGGGTVVVTDALFSHLSKKKLDWSGYRM